MLIIIWSSLYIYIHIYVYTYICKYISKDQIADVNNKEEFTQLVNAYLSSTY